MFMTYNARTVWITDTGMTALLLMLAVTIFVAPFGDAGRAFLELFFVLVLLSGAWAIADHRKIATLLAVLGVGALAIA